jgi:hypothetical protein
MSTTTAVPVFRAAPTKLRKPHRKIAYHSPKISSEMSTKLVI